MVRQFDLCRTREGDYVIVLQSDLLEDLSTRVVCLALPDLGAPAAVPALSPVLTAGDIRLRIVPHILATLTLAELGPLVMNMAHERDRIIRALDIVLTGS